jgi:putative hydrolase of the HAD superfamily
MSFEIGYKKPDIHAFQAVTNYYKVQPEDVFFIDDRQANVDAACKYGMTGAIFTDAETLVKTFEKVGIL